MVLNYNLKASLTTQAPVGESCLFFEVVTACLLFPVQDVCTALAVLHELLAMHYTSQDLRQVPDLVTSVRKVYYIIGSAVVGCVCYMGCAAGASLLWQ